MKGVADVSKFHEKLSAYNGEVTVTPKDILAADGGSDIYAVEDVDDPAPEPFAVDSQFKFTIWTDATYASDETSRRSDLGVIICLNDAPVDWDAARMTGVANSSMESEYCAMGKGTRRAKLSRGPLNFMGIQPPPDEQFCDSTAASQIVRNPHSMGASHKLGIRLHSSRYAIAHENLQLHYSITEDMVADCLTKKLPRKILARGYTPNVAVLQLRTLKLQKKNISCSFILTCFYMLFFMTA